MQLLDLLLVLPVLILDHPLDQLAGLVPELIVANIHLDLAIVHVHNIGANRIQEVAVVADHQGQRLAVQQKVLQPLDGLDV